MTQPGEPDSYAQFHLPANTYLGYPMQYVSVGFMAENISTVPQMWDLSSQTPFYTDASTETLVNSLSLSLDTLFTVLVK